MADEKPLTQEAFDKLYGELKAQQKESKDTIQMLVAKLDKSEKEKVNILARIATMENKSKPKEEEEIVEYSEENPPKTKEEWDEFFYQNPTAASDLRTILTTKRKEHEDNWLKKQKESVEELVKLHPDMYKKDANGNVLKDKNGLYVIDEASEKGKIFIEIAGQDPGIMNVATGARIVRLAMEKQLKDKEEVKVKDDLEAKKKKEEEDRQAKVKAGQVAGGGGNPPPPPEDIEVKYTSEEERKWVQDGIKAGRFKDEKHYMRVKGSVAIVHGRGGF